MSDRTDRGAGAGPDPDADSGPATDPGSDSPPDSRTETRTEAEAEADPDSGARAGTRTGNARGSDESDPEGSDADPTDARREGRRAGAHGRGGRLSAPGDPERAGGARLTSGDTTVIARTVVRIAAPIMLLTAVSLLLQGHNLPGGGFIGGVLTAAAFTLLYVVYGMAEVGDKITGVSGRVGEVTAGGADSSARWTMSIGLAVALASGLAPMLAGFAFLTQGVLFLTHPVPGPLFHEVEVASALAFDLGVYLTVVGGLMTIVREVGGE